MLEVVSQQTQQLEAFRADDGAKIAIDHFVLVPRGL